MSGVKPRGHTFGGLEWVSLAIAAVWGVGLLAAAALVPVYRSAGGSSASVGGSSSGVVGHGSATLIGVNGWGVLPVAGVPLAATVIVGIALWRRGTRRGAGVLAWTIAGLLVGFNVLALASIGMFVVPVTACVVVACASHGQRRDRQVKRPASPAERDWQPGRLLPPSDP